MDTEKQWDAFEENDSQFRKSESVQQDIQQILDTVTQIKTDVDQLKGENTDAAGPVDTEPALSAPEDNQPPAAPPMDMSGAAPGGETPQELMGDLMAQPEDGAATPAPAQEPAMPELMPQEPAMPEAAPMDVPPLNLKQENDRDILLSAARRMEDPSLIQQVLAIVYQSIEDEKEPPAPPIEEQLPPGAEEILAAAMDANGDGMISEDEIEPMMRSAGSESVQCDANPAEGIEGKPSQSVAMSDDEKKDDEEEKKEDDKEEDKKKEPGVNDGLPSKDEDKDSTEDLPEVTEVKIETEDIDEPEEQTPEETSDEKEDAIDSIIDSILEDAKERIKEQVVEAVDGIDAEHSPFLMSTAEMMSLRRSGGSHRAFKTGPVKKSIEWPESFEDVSMEDKCRYFAKSFTQLPAAIQDDVVTLMDTRLGSDVTSSIFKSEGVDLDSIYESVQKGSGQTPEQTYTAQCADDVEGTASEDNGGMTESEQKSEPVQEGLMDTLTAPIDNYKKKKLENKYQAAGPDPTRRVASAKGGWDMVPEGMSDKDRKTHMKLDSKGKAPQYGFKDRTISSYGGRGLKQVSQADYDKATSSVQNSDDDTESLEECKKSADIGMHIPTVNEMMSFRKSHTSMYTAISREAAEPHGIVDMGTEQTIPSVKDMFAKRFGKS